MPENKVRYGLRNAHYSKITENADGTLSFGIPKPLPGSVNLTLTASGDPIQFFADDTTYYQEDTNNGYDGKFELSRLTEDFRKDCLGETNNGEAMIENADSHGSKFALLFEFQGDKKATRHVVYYCSASRPEQASATKSDKTEVQTTTLEFTSAPRPDNRIVKANTSSTVSDAVYNGWYDAVYEPTLVPATGLTLVPDTISLAIGAIQQLAATVSPANATNRNVTYLSSDPTIATVSDTGLITAVAVGSATITAKTADGSFTDTCAVTVA
ncbi:Ig-like domain-containing protein [Sporolactobacillus sp. CQH2019]|uniref:major tail protein n=1 Tax=Sporolactobacillus sp. CQH2019 TaxID=3023512 RepID=UPI0023680C65|nr:major tail protein [Sporolactobacillus sp. CQH2019]MDD9148159.1 Ig-like domain-containing protein [Sporolactobacillus sp. CQH2019]